MFSKSSCKSYSGTQIMRAHCWYIVCWNIARRRYGLPGYIRQKRELNMAPAMMSNDGPSPVVSSKMIHSFSQIPMFFVIRRSLNPLLGHIKLWEIWASIHDDNKHIHFTQWNQFSASLQFIEMMRLLHLVVGCPKCAKSSRVASNKSSSSPTSGASGTEGRAAVSFGRTIYLQVDALVGNQLSNLLFRSVIPKMF